MCWAAEARSAARPFFLLPCSLASDDASYITGQTVYVDGGRMALNYTVPVPE